MTMKDINQRIKCWLEPKGFSPVLKVVKHVVIKSAPDLMWLSIKGADRFIYGNCGQSMWSVYFGFRSPKVVVL